MAQNYTAALLALSGDSAFPEARRRLFETMVPETMSEVAQLCLQNEVSTEVLAQVTSPVLDDCARQTSGAAPVAPSRKPTVEGQFHHVENISNLPTDHT